MSRRPILLLVNPVAGGKPGSPPALDTDPALLAGNALANALRARGLEVRLHELTEDDDTGKLAADAVGHGQDIVVSGGDGTVGKVAAAMAGGEGTLGILARGSFNNIARGFGVPLTLDAALDAIATGHATRFDAGWAYRTDVADGRWFFEAGGVGLDAVGFLAVELAERRGWWRAVRATLRGLRLRRTPMRVTLDDSTHRMATPTVTVSNLPFYGMGFAVAEQADPTDGRFDIAVFHRMTRFDVVRHMLAVARHRTRREPRIAMHTAARVTIEGVRRALPAHADGESIGLTPVTFEVRPGALRVFR